MSVRNEICAGVALAALVGLGAPSHAVAQETDEDDAMEMDRVMVTAQRRAEDLQDVPIAVTAFSAEDLEKLQISEPLDIADYVPNLYAHNNTGLGSANVYFIRGLGNTESIATFDPPVGTYVDEVYIARQNANNVAFFDVESVQILRGPQGTLFGRNTTGGAVVITMRKPGEEFGGYFEAGYGNFDRYMFRGSVDVPLTENVLTKFSGFFIDEDGFVDNIVTGETLNGQEAFGVRGDLRVLFSDTATLDVSAEYSEDEGLNILNFVEGGSVLVPPTEPGRRVSQTGLTTSDSDAAPIDRILAGEGLGVFNETFTVNGNLEVEAGPGVFNLIVGYRTLEQRFVIDFFDGGLGGQGFSTGGFTIGNDGEHDQASIELKYFASLLDGMVDVTAGAFYFNEDNDTEFADVFTVGPSAAAAFPITLANRLLENELDSYAVYTQFDVRPIERLTLTAGVRWTQEEKNVDFTDLRDPPLSTSPTALNSENLLAFGIPLEQTVSRLTPRFVINYEFTDDLSVFASATSGFKSGGWNARGTSAAFLTAFGPEEALSYETGLRSEFFDNRLRFNATAFFLDVEDAQIISGVDTVGGIEFLTDNFADIETFGLEFDAQALVTEELTIFASLGLQESIYRNIDPSILAQQEACLIALANSAPTAGLCEAGIVTPTGAISDPVRIPPVTASLGATYDFYIPSIDATLTPTINGRYVGETFVATDNQPLSEEDGYFVLNAGLTLASDLYGVTITGECTNCTNSLFLTNDLANTLYLNEPRRWMVRVKKSF